MRGGLPDPKAIRRNVPTIPTTSLPAGGRKDPAPKLPSWVELAESGSAWWAWAWATPQASAWSPGHESVVARRASLEDDLAATSAVEGLDGAEALAADKDNVVKDLIRRLASLASNRLQIHREMRELDDRLGLSPKGQAQLRWQIVADESTEPTKENDEVAKKREDRWARASNA